jgi:hypothetical protein
MLCYAAAMLCNARGDQQAGNGRLQQEKGREGNRRGLVDRRVPEQDRTVMYDA